MAKKDNQDILIQSFADFSKVYKIISSGDFQDKITLVVGMPELRPIEVLIITQFSIWLQKRSSNLTLLVSPKLKKYLDSIGLSEFCKTNIQSPSTVESIESQTAMSIKRVDRETMHAYVNATETYLKNICQAKDLQMLNHCLSELINNVYDHSDSEIDAYVFCEYYPESNVISIAVSDLGMGISNSVKRYFKQENKVEMSEREYVKWALEENKTVRSRPHNMGKGLDNLNSFARSNDTIWKILTNGVLMESVGSENRYYDNPIPGFQGTIVVLDIRVDRLQERKFVDDDWDWLN